MDCLLEICDEMASGNDFISLRSIIECFYGYDVPKLDNDKEYRRLKKHLNRYSHIIEFQNGHDFRGGFKYKKGFEFYFCTEEEKHFLKNMNGDEKRLYLTSGLQILFEGKSSSEHIIELECVPDLKNKELVKELVKYLGRRVISFKYVPGYDEGKKMEVVIHPHLLKEFNSRWFLFGYVHQSNGIWEIVNIAIDRIVYKPNTQSIWPHPEVDFKKVTKNFYYNYFKDIVGVTHHEDKELEHIVIRTVDFKVHNLLKTKKIHASQCETLGFDVEKGFGEFTIDVVPNIELQARLLSFGSGLYVIGDSFVAKKMKDTIAKMNDLYFD